MSEKYLHAGIKFESESSDKPHITTWFDNLPPSDVKKSIIHVRCSEYLPFDEATFRLVVVCAHPFSTVIETPISPVFDSTQRSDDQNPGILDRFADWIEKHNMPEEIILRGRYAFVDWWPKEMISLVATSRTQLERDTSELNNHLLDCLELLRLTVASEEEFARLWLVSNEPFFAAGRLLHGHFQWIREAPIELFRSPSSLKEISARIHPCAREYVGLMRLAAILGAESPLLDRVLFKINLFRIQYAIEIPLWLDLAKEIVDSTEELSGYPLSGKKARYVEIGSVCNELRQDLVVATVGMESEIVTLIDAILPTLEVPPSAAFFTDKSDRRFNPRTPTV